jgi:hypothetical protein
VSATPSTAPLIEGVAGDKTSVTDEVPATGNGLNKPINEGSETVAGMAGGFENVRPKPCGRGYLSGTGCYLCDPNHPHRLKEGVKA